MPPAALLDVTHATVWVPGPTTLLDDISWSVAAGEHWALLGPNGAGKSTLLRLAAGLRHPSSGQVEVLGRRLGRVDVRRLWALIGFVNPVHPTPPDLPLRDVVLTGATGTVQPLWEHYGPAERARTAVRKAISRALDAVEAGDPALADTLRLSLRTGYECCYDPAGGVPVPGRISRP